MPLKTTAPVKTWCQTCKAVVIPDEDGVCPEHQTVLDRVPLTLDELISKLQAVALEMDGKTLVSINGCDCAELAGGVEVIRGTADHGDVVKIFRIDD